MCYYRQVNHLDLEYMMSSKLPIPEAIPPHNIPHYGLPETKEKLLSWEFVSQQMSNARYFWIATSNQEYPHTIPVWGLWHAERVFFDGSLKTKWARNLAKNPNIVVHLPGAEQVVIINGYIKTRKTDSDTFDWKKLDTLYQKKYDTKSYREPFFVVHPRKVLAWDAANLGTMTRWIFEDE
jgi:hypothetical protein